MDRKEKAILITIGANLLLVALKSYLFGASGSMALKASAWHSFGDVASSCLVLVGFLMARVLEGRRGKLIANIENIIALLISGLIFYMAFDIYREAASGTVPPDLRNLWPVTIASIATIAITYFTARYKEYVGKATDSISLVASGYHSRLDLYSSILVIMSLASSALGFGALDRLAAIVVCLLVALSGWEIASQSFAALFARRAAAGAAKAVDLHARLPRIAGAGFAIFACFTLLSGFVAVQPDERGILIRFGRIVRDVDPGLRYRIPYIDTMLKVAMDEVRQERLKSTLVLTGDTNLIDVEMGIQYRIADPRRFLFEIIRPSELIARSAEAALRETVAIRKVDDLLVGSRSEIIESIKIRSQAFLDVNGSGLEVTAVQLVSVAPPTDVAEAFRDVASAKEDKNTYISEALAYRNEILPTARGDAAKSVFAAGAEAKRKIDAATGEGDRFVFRVASYRSAPEVGRTRLYIEAMEKTLPKAKKFIIDPRVAGASTQIWISQNKMSPLLQ